MKQNNGCKPTLPISFAQLKKIKNKKIKNKNCRPNHQNLAYKYSGIQTAPYLAIFEQGGSADIFSLITGGVEMTLLRAL